MDNTSTKTLQIITNTAPNSERLYNQSGGCQLIGVIVKDIGCNFAAEVVTGIETSLIKQNKLLCLIQSGKRNQYLSEQIAALIELDLAGMILIDGSQYVLNAQRVIKKKKIPFVLVAKSTAMHNINIIKTNNWLGAKKATEMLIYSGHRRLAYCGGSRNSLVRAERIAGFGDTLFRFGLKFNPEWILDENEIMDFSRVECLLNRLPTPSAFICHNEEAAIALFMCALKYGRPVYKMGIHSYLDPQIELACFDISYHRKWLSGFIHNIDSQPYEMGCRAVHCLLNMQDDSPWEITIVPKIIT